jgi:peptide/nickel transport system substrate-binding protein
MAGVPILAALRRGALALVATMGIALAMPTPAMAQTLKVATAFDPGTLDPHAIALLYHSRVVFQIYEGLVNRNEAYGIEPALALSWQAVEPTRWRLRLRPGVRFHDGSTFTAADAVFSLQRALAPTSQRAFQLKGVLSARAVDELTIDIQLEAPDAVLPDKLQYIAMMSRAWSEKHGVQSPQDFDAKQETYAGRHANGTGPFRLVRYESDVRVSLQRHADWWGAGDAAHRARNGNLQEAQFVTIRSDATRVAALASGEIDIVLDPPFQDVKRLQRDPKLRVIQTADMGQQYFAMDQASTELRDSSLKGRNPFKDVRVRRAVYHALNVPLIIDKVLRGQAEPTGAFLGAKVNGVPPEPGRLPYDPARARALLREAGYPQGFDLTMDCVNVAWREAVCQAATAMLTQVGIRTTLRSSVSTQFFPKLSQAQGSFMEFGWNPSTDAWNSLNALVRTFSPKGFGTFNAGRYSNPALDAEIDAIRTEPDLQRRNERVAGVLATMAQELPLVPLYRRKLTWAMRSGVSAVIWPNDTLELRWVRVTP